MWLAGHRKHQEMVTGPAPSFSDQPRHTPMPALLQGLPYKDLQVLFQELRSSKGHTAPMSLCDTVPTPLVTHLISPPRYKHREVGDQISTSLWTEPFEQGLTWVRC